MNEYDSDKMADVMVATRDMQVTLNPEEADVLLLNTCSIREKAQEKVFSQLGQWRDLKKKNPNLVIGVGGCVASQEGEALKARAPQVDVVFGPQTLHRLPDLIDQAREKVSRLSISVFLLLRNSIVCPHLPLMALVHLSQLWRDAASIALIV